MSGGRIWYSEVAPGTTQVVVGPRENPASAAIGAVAAPVIGFGFFGTAAAIISQPPRDVGGIIFVALWLSGFGGLGALLLFGAAWNSWGYWELVFDSAKLTVTAKIFGLRKSWTYAVPDISNMRIQEQRGARTLVTRTIVFDHPSGLKHATPSLTWEEANALLAGPLAELTRRHDWATA